MDLERFRLDVVILPVADAPDLSKQAPFFFGVSPFFRGLF
jgi:hypothetical protein